MWLDDIVSATMLEPTPVYDDLMYLAKKKLVKRSGGTGRRTESRWALIPEPLDRMEAALGDDE